MDSNTVKATLNNRGFAVSETLDFASATGAPLIRAELISTADHWTTLLTGPVLTHAEVDALRWAIQLTGDCRAGDALQGLLGRAGVAKVTPAAIPVAQIEQGVRNALSDPFLFPKQAGQLTVADERMVNLWTEKVMKCVTGTFPPTPETARRATLKAMTEEAWCDMTGEDQRRYVRDHNIPISCTTDIGGAFGFGWGVADSNGFWQFPCDWYTPTPVKPEGG